MNLIGRYVRYLDWHLAFTEYNNRKGTMAFELWDVVMERFNAYRAMCTEGMDGI